MDRSATDTWQARAEEQIHAILSGLSNQLSAEWETAAAFSASEAKGKAQREVWESWNQTLRQLRRAGDRAAVISELVEATAPHAKRAAWFTFDETNARAEAQRNLGPETLQFPAHSAAAFLSALESREPVVAAATAQEISPLLADALAEGSGERAYLFPLLVRDQIEGVLFTADVAQPAALEALAEAGAMRLELLKRDAAAVAPKPVSSSAFVQLEGQAPAAAKSWADLNAAEQRLHLRAQRVARVAVAELRLANREKLRRGLAQSDLYSVLQPELDGLRNQYREQFVAGTPSMVDYLHLEFIRSLANHDERLLGPHYPGPLV